MCTPLISSLKITATLDTEKQGDDNEKNIYIYKCIHIYTHTQTLPDTLLLNLLGGGAAERERGGEVKLTSLFLHNDI